VTRVVLYDKCGRDSVIHTIFHFSRIYRRGSACENSGGSVGQSATGSTDRRGQPDHRRPRPRRGGRQIFDGQQCRRRGLNGR